MKPEVTKVKDARGRITGYRATIGSVERYRQTPADASAACEAATLEALARLERGITVRTFRGHTFIVAPTLHGFGYWLDTFSNGYNIQNARDTREETIADALHHLAQNVWTHETDDAAFLADLPEPTRVELASWICFQRAFKRLAAEGKPDHECHRLACQESSSAA